MNTEDLKTTLDRVFYRTPDELLDIADQLPEEEARILRNASYDIESVRASQAVNDLTRAAVGEAVQAAFTHHGGVGVTEATILRERAG